VCVCVCVCAHFFTSHALPGVDMWGLEEEDFVLQSRQSSRRVSVDLLTA
jgi:hypothetical protein